MSGFPIGLIWLIVVLYRAYANSRGSEPAAPRRGLGASTGSVLSRPLSIDGRHLLVWFVGSVAVLGALAAARNAPVVATLVLCATSVALFPWLLTRYVLIPLKWRRASSALARLALWTFRHDPGAGPMLAEALVLTRKYPAPEREIARLESRLCEPTSRTMRGASITAHGLLAMSKGQFDRARWAFESLEMLHPLAAPAVARRIGSRFRMATAAASGDWKSLERLAAGYGRLTRSAWFYGALARWHLGRRTIPLALWLRVTWALAPGRRRSRAWLNAAIAGRRTSEGDAEKPAMLPEWSHAVIAPFDEALRRHAALAIARDGPAASEAWRACAAAWRAVFDDHRSSEHVKERGRELGVVKLEEALGLFGSSVRHDLASEARRPGIDHEDLSAGGPVGSWVAAYLIEEDLRDIEFRVQAIEERQRAKTILPIGDVWLEVAALHTKFEESAHRLGEPFVCAACPVIGGVVLNHAAEIYNNRGERPIANATFRWLARCAERAGNAELFRICDENGALGF